MPKRLTEFLDPRTLNPTMADIAKAVKKPLEKLSVPTNKQWKWASVFYALVEGEGSRFGSYRALGCWVEAVVQMLRSCNDWQKLAELIDATEAELEIYPYRDEHKQLLGQVLVQQKVRYLKLKEQAAGSIRAWNWARGWAPVLQACPNEKSLNIALQLYKSQKQQFAAYAEAIAWVVQVGRQQRQYLRHRKTA